MDDTYSVQTTAAEASETGGLDTLQALKDGDTFLVADSLGSSKTAKKFLKRVRPLHPRLGFPVLSELPRLLRNSCCVCVVTPDPTSAS